MVQWQNTDLDTTKYADSMLTQSNASNLQQVTNLMCAWTTQPLTLSKLGNDW